MGSRGGAPGPPRVQGPRRVGDCPVLYVHVVSKLMQAKEVDLNLVTELLNTTVQHFRDMRASFKSHHDEAIDYAAKYKVTSHFKEARNRKTKRFHDELANDERLLNSLDKFRVNIFYPTIDTCINKVLIRFESFRAISTRFGFMMPGCQPNLTK